MSWGFGTFLLSVVGYGIYLAVHTVTKGVVTLTGRSDAAVDRETGLLASQCVAFAIGALLYSLRRHIRSLFGRREAETGIQGEARAGH
jgi:hypothetical protein